MKELTSSWQNVESRGRDLERALQESRQRLVALDAEVSGVVVVVVLVLLLLLLLSVIVVAAACVVVEAVDRCPE